MVSHISYNTLSLSLSLSLSLYLSLSYTHQGCGKRRSLSSLTTTQTMGARRQSRHVLRLDLNPKPKLVIVEGNSNDGSEETVKAQH